MRSPSDPASIGHPPVDCSAVAAAGARRACCVNLGCSENRLEGSLIGDYLKRNDWSLVDDPASADLIIVNSCGFTEGNERQSLATYKQLAAVRRPGARIVFAGCLPAMNKDAILAAGYDDVLVTPRTLLLLDSITNARLSIASGTRPECIPFSADGMGVGFSFEHTRAQHVLKQIASVLVARRRVPVPRWLWQFLYLPDAEVEFVRVSVGCSSHCSFCSIPQAKGTTRSVAPETVLAHVREALRRGKRQIALSCDELASYGQDLGTDIVALLDRITALPGDFHLILRNVHPEWAIKYWDGLLPLFRRGKIAYVIAPVQSGSDRVLRLMRRNHTAGQYRQLVGDIRSQAPGVILRTHFLVGFPGETEEDFRDTCAFAKALPVDSFCVHEYSERKKTPASRMPDRVGAPVIRRRASTLRHIEWKNFGKAFRWLPLRPQTAPPSHRPGPRKTLKLPT